MPSCPSYFVAGPAPLFLFIRAFIVPPLQSLFGSLPTPMPVLNPSCCPSLSILIPAPHAVMHSCPAPFYAVSPMKKEKESTRDREHKDREGRDKVGHVW